MLKAQEEKKNEILDRADRMLEERTKIILDKQKEDEKWLLTVKIWKYEQELLEQEKWRIAKISNEYNVIWEKRKQEYLKS